MERAWVLMTASFSVGTCGESGSCMPTQAQHRDAALKMWTSPLNTFQGRRRLAQSSWPWIHDALPSSKP